MKRFLFALILIAYPATTWAGVCTTMIHRICQPGKTCRTSESHTQLVNTAEDCLALARRMCPVYFTEGVAGKQVRAQFDSVPLGSGHNLCQ